MQEQQAPDAPTEEERELVIDETHSNEGDLERLMQMDEEWPDHFEERSHGPRGDVEEAGQRKLDAMANMAARPQSLQDYLHDQLGWFDLEPGLRTMADRIIYNLDTNGYLQGRLEDLLGPDAGEEDWPWRNGPWLWCRSSIRPASARGTCASACCSSWFRAFPITNRSGR